MQIHFGDFRTDPGAGDKIQPIDCLWYDGWWPFNAEGWRAVEMNAMVRRFNPYNLQRKKRAAR